MCYKLTYKNTKGEWITKFYKNSLNATNAANEVLRIGETHYITIERYEIKTED